MGGYGVRLGAVAVAQVESFRTGGAPLSCSLSYQCSPLVAKFVELEPLGALLTRAVEGGLVLRDGLWHPERPPRSHSPDEVRRLARELGRAWMVSLFVHASAQDEAVVSAALPVLEGPDGQEVRLFED
jgi:hypothetical protein